MDLAITQVPYWISALFIVSFSTLPLYLVARTVKQAHQKVSPEKGTQLQRKVWLFYGVFFILVAVTSLTGFFAKNFLPPRIIVFVTLPLFLFYLLYVHRSAWFKVMFTHIKIEALIFIHVFRFIGVFFFLVYAYDALPKSFAFIGGSGDILTALLAIPVVMAFKKGVKYAIKLAWIWNIIGLLDIGSVLVSAVVLTQQAVEMNTPGVQQFGTFPFSWIPAFAPATIVFLHLLIFKKLREKANT